MRKDICDEIKKFKNPQKAKDLQRFFKTGKGEYGEGDVFYGIMVPQSRIIAKKFNTINLNEIHGLLKSPVHEMRLIALLVLVDQFQHANEKNKKNIYRFYLAHTNRINNWDLVDLTAVHIVGTYLFNKSYTPLLRLAKSKSVWERRIAVIATFYFINKKQSDLSFQIAKILLHDKHDLIQKAVGWMLREIGKRCSQEIEESFLINHYSYMPRTMLRYAIERFPKDKREYYLRRG